MAADSAGVWHVTGKGTLSRQVPTTATIFVIPTGQFYNKTVQHEQVHISQWIEGPGHLFGDLIIVDDFYSQIQGLTGSSQTDLINKLASALQTYETAQSAIYTQRIPQAEQEAHAVSDPIAPQYIYQLCSGGGPSQ